MRADSRSHPPNCSLGSGGPFSGISGVGSRWPVHRSKIIALPQCLLRTTLVASDSTTYVFTIGSCVWSHVDRPRRFHLRSALLTRTLACTLRADVGHDQKVRDAEISAVLAAKMKWVQLFAERKDATSASAWTRHDSDSSSDTANHEVRHDSSLNTGSSKPYCGARPGLTACQASAILPKVQADLTSAV